VILKAHRRIPNDELDRWPDERATVCEELGDWIKWESHADAPRS
jgi:hypothetical protein